MHSCYKIKDRHFGTLDGACKTCKISYYKIKDRHFGLLMGRVKLVKIMLQNQRQTKNLYRIDSNQNLYRIILEVFTKKNPTYVTKGSSRGATLSFTLRSKGEGGQPRYLIIQEIASRGEKNCPGRRPYIYLRTDLRQGAWGKNVML